MVMLELRLMLVVQAVAVVIKTLTMEERQAQRTKVTLAVMDILRVQARLVVAVVQVPLVAIMLPQTLAVLVALGSHHPFQELQLLMLVEAAAVGILILAVLVALVEAETLDII